LPARRLVLLPLLLLAALAPGVALAAGGTPAVGTGTGRYGTLSGTVPQPGMNVVLMEAAPGRRGRSRSAAQAVARAAASSSRSPAPKPK
jgi:hypothetical protein